MAYSRPTLAELVTRASSNFATRLSISGALLSRSLAGIYARVVAGVAHGLYGYIEYISKQLTPATATGAWLVYWAQTYGISPALATFASGSVTFTGTNGSIIEAGEILQAPDGVQFIVNADVSVSGGEALVAITALNAGSAGNLPAGVGISLVKPVDGVNSTAIVDAAGISGGANQADDDTLRAALLSRIQQPPRGGSKEDYRRWALEIPGVTRAFVFPLRDGPGTVGLTVLLDNEASIIPDAGKIAEVQAHIDGLAPVTAVATAFIPTEVALDLTIKITPNTAIVQAAITAEITDFLQRVSVPEGFMYVSQLDEAISIAEGEINHEITSYSVAPSVGRIIAGTGEIITPGTLTFESF